MHKLKIPRKSKLVIAYSGGCCSSTLLSLFFDSLYVAKSVFDFDISVVSISFDGIHDLIPLSKSLNLSKLASIYRFPIELLKAEEHALFSDNVERMHQIFSKMHSIDSKQDLLHLIESQLLSDYCNSLGRKTYLLYGYTMDHLTEKVVHSLSNCNGFTMAYSCSTKSIVQIPNSEVYIAYPLSTLTSRELSLYCHYQSIPYITNYQFLSTRGDSVYRLARSMVQELQTGCDSTLHIVTETMSKLKQGPIDMKEQAKICELCKEWSSSQQCGRCQFLLKEDQSGYILSYLES